MPRPPKRPTEGTRPKDAPASLPDAASIGAVPSASAPARAVSERKPPTSHTTADSAPHKSPVGMASNISDEEIRRRAYELYESRGGNGGSPEDDWYRAEQELRSRKSSKSA
jgi:hypothetical protein